MLLENFIKVIADQERLGYGGKSSDKKSSCPTRLLSRPQSHLIFSEPTSGRNSSELHRCQISSSLSKLRMPLACSNHIFTDFKDKTRFKTIITRSRFSSNSKFETVNFVPINCFNLTQKLNQCFGIILSISMNGFTGIALWRYLVMWWGRRICASEQNKFRCHTKKKEEENSKGNKRVT